MPTSSRSDRAAALALVAGGLAFAVFATLNAGGYRYGVSDQAFYIPAVLRHLDPSLFPRDWTMLGAQGRFFFVDEIFATLVRTTGLALPVWFAVAQIAMLTTLCIGAWRLGAALGLGPWGLIAWMAALTLRHRIAKTGANTLEGYFHPRMLVFALGMLALADVLRGRTWRPLAIVAVSAALHPTTAAMFGALVAIALLVDHVRARTWWLVAAGAVVLAGPAALAVTVLSFELRPMDDVWRELVATKDYTFPTAWSLSTWATNLLGSMVLVGVGLVRHRAGLLRRVELGLIVGCLLLVLGFLASLPLIARGVPLAVQLQTSRVFWPVEVIATLFLVWWLVERLPRATGRTRLAPAIALALVSASVLRGAYVGFVEHRGRPVLAVDVEDSDWVRALRWIRDHSPPDTYVLAAPGHAWQHGAAVRIVAARDVYLEEVKDVAMAMYSRTVAWRVQGALDRAASLDRMDEAAIEELAATEGLAVLVSARALDLPVLHQSGPFRIYRLGS